MEIGDVDIIYLDFKKPLIKYDINAYLIIFGDMASEGKYTA